MRSTKARHALREIKVTMRKRLKLRIFDMAACTVDGQTPKKGEKTDSLTRNKAETKR